MVGMMQMEEPGRDSSVDNRDDYESSPLLLIGLPVLAIIVVTASLYFAKDVLLPLTVAFILSIVLSPLAARLERYLGRALSASLLVLFGVILVAGVTYFTFSELTTVADEVAGYSNNIGNKIVALQKSTPQWIKHLQSAVANVERRADKPAAAGANKTPPRTIAVSSDSTMENLKAVAPIVAGAVESLLVLALLFFLLYERRDLRDRFVRLAARARITIAGEAIQSAGHVVGRYLLMLTLLNAAFGACIWGVLALLGVPDAGLWGFLAFLLRYIPYVGSAIAAGLPTLVAFAVFPGWAKAIEVVAAFLVLDQILTHLAQPVVLGSGLDLSPVALLVSAVYWTWLWGIPGLLLAVPLAACLRVAGDHVPAFNFLSVLLGGKRRLEDHQDLYRMLLELDQSGARNFAIRHCNENGLESTFNDLVSPTIQLAGQEHQERNISGETFQFIIESIDSIISDLGSRFYEPRSTPRVRVLGVTAPEEPHNLGLMMILELFRHAGANVRLVGENKSREEICQIARQFSPDLVCLSCTISDALTSSAQLTRALRHDLPQLSIIAGGIATLSFPQQLAGAGCSQMVGTRSQVRRAIKQFTAAGRAPKTGPDSSLRDDLPSVRNSV